MAKANTAFSDSLTEIFSLVMAGAMAIGQPLLRTRTGGWHEQLLDTERRFDLGEVSAHSQPAQQIALLPLLRDPRSVPGAGLQGIRVKAHQQASRLSSSLHGAWLCD